MFIKKTIFSYLDSLYPDLYNYETLFGVTPRMNKSNVNILNVTDDIIRMFHCDYTTATEVVDEWLLNRPVKSFSPRDEVDLVFFL